MVTRVVVVVDAGLCGPYAVDEVLSFRSLDWARGFAEGRESETLTVFIEGDPDGHLAEWREDDDPGRRAFVPVIEAAFL